MNVKSETVNKLISKWQRRFYVNDWEITWSVQSMEYNWGQIYLEPEYRKAHMNLDIQSHPNLKELDKTIRHEVIHILHAHFEEAFFLVKKTVDKKMWDVLHAQYKNACEKIVRDLEDIFDDFEWS